MTASDLSNIQLPASVAGWMNIIIFVFVGLVVVWAGLKAAGLLMRRAYNLTPVGTAASKDVRPDFLKVDHEARKRLGEQGKRFDLPQEKRLARASSAAGLGVIASGAISFISAAFLAFGRIEDLDATWRNLSASERFFAIVQSHPYGFTLALLMVGGALVRLASSVRRAG